MKIIINGRETPLNTDGLPRFADLVELIKASIDPDHMIAMILLDDQEIPEEVWTKSMNQINADTLTVETDTPDHYVAEKIKAASSVVRSCYLEFRDSRKAFQDGDMTVGNQRLKVAVDTLRAFFEWYGTLVQLVPEDRRSGVDVTPHVREISETCKKIVQQQLYQSWWALGETIEKELEPRLDKLEDFCRRAVKQVAAAAAA